MTQAPPSGPAPTHLESQTLRLSRVRRKATAVAVSLMLGTAIAQALIVWVLATDAPGAAWLATEVYLPGRVRGGFHPLALGLALPLLLAFGYGVYMLVHLNVESRQVGRVDPIYRFSTIINTALTYPVRPLSIGVHLAWVALPAALFYVGYPLQLRAGLLTPEALDRMAHPGSVYWLIAMPAISALGLAAAVLLSVIKKLSYPGQLRRHPGPVTPTQRATYVLFEQRADLSLAFLGGLIAGVAPLRLSLGDATSAQVLVVIGGLFFAVAVVMALQFWRTGKRLYAPETE